jgi:hypothetical protein
MKRMKPLALSVALLAVVPALAHAAGTVFSGETSQGRDVVLKANDEKLPYRLNVGFRAPCSDEKRLKAGTFFRAPFDRRTRRRIRDAGEYTFRLGEERIDADVSMRGRKVSRRKWRGRYEGHFVVKRDGRRVATCETPVVRWRVTKQ